jgi:hypothetical protein
MRRLILALFTLLASLSAHAADDILKAVKSRLADAPVVRGEFVQMRELAGVKKPLRAEGDFVVMRGRGVIWRTAKPFPQTLRVTAGEILQRDGDNTLMRLSADKEPVVAAISRTLFGLFAGDLDQLTRFFNAEGSVDGSRWQLKLVPKEQALAKLIGQIDVDGARTVEHVRLDAPSGDRTRIEMRRITMANSPDAAEGALFE